MVPLVGVERWVGVGVMEVMVEEGDSGVSAGSGTEWGNVWGVKTSLRGVGLVNKLTEGCETLGRMNDVSKLISGPLGAPLEMMLDGARMEDSNDASVSSAHWEGCKEGVGLTGGSCGDSDEMVIVGVRCEAGEGG